ncbi:hypothetical protein [Psychromonas sp. 14N.309.X.WAT.B.A12]|uniref:hypothetical protein n=1 Tax=unclassified Psychromonas TaxID=2614957 RepID=UPI0025B1FDAE|nr:hypothetical protein [Psychromonas sp. 14N.309.X.WAT.B.A12]MDN2663905.1 hypothetical protein [Psychromonas sp. 14N.309.X.WAT.B.A12]
MKYSIVLLFSLFSFFALAKEQPVLPNQETLKSIGDALANYEKCQGLAESEGDSVMAYYYQDIKQTTLAENTAYSEAELAYINSEYEKGTLLLSYINSAGLYQLCLNRFDSVSRQYYKAKLNSTKD